MNKSWAAIVFALVAVMPVAHAYWVGGTGFLMPIKQKQHYLVFKHNFNDTIEHYVFWCDEYNMAAIVGGGLYVSKVCPPEYPVRSMEINFTENVSSGSLQIYAFEPKRSRMKVRHGRAELSLMFRTNLEEIESVNVELKLKGGGERKAYESENLRRFKSVKSLKKIGESSENTYYLVKISGNTKYLTLTR